MKIKGAPFLAGFLTAGLLTAVKLAAPYQMLLADRFFKEGGWVEIVLLSVYAALVLRSYSASGDTSRIRLRI